MSAAELRKLADLGLTGAQIAAVAEILDAREETCSKPSRSERNRRYYEKRLKTTENVLNASESSESVLIKTPPSPPPPSPLHPPSPAPTPGSISAGAHTREGSGPLSRTSPAPDKNHLPAIPEAAAAPLRSLFSRRESTGWTAKEIAAFRKLRLPESQLLADLEIFAKARQSGWAYYRRDTLTLLNNWHAETERAADYLATLTKPTSHGHHSRTNRTHVTRNVEPLPANRPSLNATAVGYGQDRLEDLRGPSIDENGNECW